MSVSRRTFTEEQKAKIRAWLAEQPEPDLDDPDNPEWTEEDFARGVGPEQMSETELNAFPRTREYVESVRRQRRKQVSIRLDPEIIDHFRAGGRDWQVRLNAALRSVLPVKA